MKEDIVVVCETTTTIIVHFCRLSQLVRPIYAPCGTRRIMGAIEEKEFLNLGQRGICTSKPQLCLSRYLTSLFSQFCKRLQIQIVAKTRNLMTNFPTLEKRFPSFHSLPWDFNGIECTFFTLKLNSRRKVITIHLCNFFFYKLTDE